jgi:ribonucleoside-diphosphate reductase alpha chain
MTIDFAEILHDLELKRTAARPADARALPNLGVALSMLEFEATVILTGEDGGDEAFTPAAAAELVAEALGDLALAHGEHAADTAAGRALVRSTTERVLERLAADRATQLTLADLSALVEATLIEAGHYEVAKALVMRRGEALAAVAASAVPLRLIRRSGDVVAWNVSKIEVAIRKAFLSLHQDPSPAITLTARVGERVGALGHAYVPIEAIQDIVQEELVLAGHMRVAERYIVYRAERALLRAQQSGERMSPPAIPLLEDDGTETSWDGGDLRMRIEFASSSPRSASTSRSPPRSLSASCAARSARA